MDLLKVDPLLKIGCNAEMIIQDTGHIGEDVYVIGSAATPVYLMDGPVPVIFDAGLTAAAYVYEAGIREILGNRRPAYIFLTHSHFDHIGSVSHFKKVWPQLQVAGSARCSEILKRENAVRLMRALNVEGAKDIGTLGIDRDINENPFEPFELDILVQPDQKIQLTPEISVTALNTPGHTWDFMSYWIPEKKVLIASEAVAVYDGHGYLQPEFLVDFDAYLDSLTRMQDLDAKILCGGHNAVFTGDDAAAHFHGSVKAVKDYLYSIQEFLTRENGDIDRAVSRIKSVEWDPRPWPKQPESAYLLNTRQRVKTIRERMDRQTESVTQ